MRHFFIDNDRVPFSPYFIVKTEIQGKEVKAQLRKIFCDIDDTYEVEEISRLRYWLFHRKHRHMTYPLDFL